LKAELGNGEEGGVERVGKVTVTGLVSQSRRWLICVETIHAPKKGQERRGWEVEVEVEVEVGRKG
jgi:hypothetical protein